MDGLAAIVLAAGYSSRMRSFKPLLNLGGRTFLARAVGAFTAVGIDDVVVVTGHRGDEVAAAAARLGAGDVPNPRFDDGMYTSIQAGVAALPPSARRFFLLPVDCPLVRPETVGRLARAGAVSDADVVLPLFEGASGHPPLISTALSAEILASHPPGGLRTLLAARAGRTLEIAVNDPGVAFDADTADDLDRARELARAADLPSEERCGAVLCEHGASPELIAHSRAVAAVAAALTTALNERDQHLCLALVVTAALLHDVARGEPRHAEAGAAFVARLGYPRVAAVVREHIDLAGGADDLGEAAVVYLADKLVRGDRLVSIEERFSDRLRRFAADPPALAAAQARLQTAQAVRRRVEEVLGRRLELA